MRRILLSIISLTLCLACSKKQVVSSTHDPTDKVIYGDDNRADLYTIKDTAWYEIAKSTVALMDSAKLIEFENHYEVPSKKFGEQMILCEGEPFWHQPIAADCSGFLIDEDIVITAGHCVRVEGYCHLTSFIFDYSYRKESDNPTKVPKENVYQCKRLIHSQANGVTNNDFAVIQLDRKVKDRSPLPYRQQGQIQVGDKVTVIGHPFGLPTKFADDATVRETFDSIYFKTNLDTFAGNSGSPIFNENTGLVEGILVRGDVDFVFEDGCRHSRICPASGCKGEVVNRISNILDYLPGSPQ